MTVMSGVTTKFDTIEAIVCESVMIGSEPRGVSIIVAMISQRITTATTKN